MTAGREVENYIPIEVVEKIAADRKWLIKKKPGQYDHFFKCVLGPKGGDRSDDKTKIARWATELFTAVQIKDHLDLAGMLDQVCSKIREWNGMKGRIYGVQAVSASLFETIARKSG